MKLYLFIICTVFFSQLFAQDTYEITENSKVNEVTVFMDRAQIVRNKTVNLKAGISLVKFNKLSPYIETKSVRVKALGDITVLAVNHQQNFINNQRKSAEYLELEKKLNTLIDKQKMEQMYLSVIAEEIKLLQENRKISGQNGELNINNLQQIAAYYSKRFKALRMEEIERKKANKELNRQIANFRNQINTLSEKSNEETGEILVKIEAKKAGAYSLSVNYIVRNAGWYPSYDVRVKDINEPLELSYKANVRQDTKEDWDNIKIRFSSATPNESTQKPELKTYFLDYHLLPPTYNREVNEVRGKVVSDSDGLGLPGVSVLVEGTSIGTTTDIDGNYTLTVPRNATNLIFHLIGMVSQTVPINRTLINISLAEDITSLDEIVVTGFGNQLNNNMTGSVKKIKEQISSRPIPVSAIENQTTLNFEIEQPYTVKSDNKNYTIEMVNYKIDADYQYYSIPKITSKAFLIASITDWQKYNLLPAEANIFIENTFIGKTLLDNRFVDDSLDISLGEDKNVSVRREKIKDYTDKKFIGNNKTKIREWKISVKNNKSLAIKMTLLDQVPVSTSKEIEVSIEELSKAIIEKETGKVTWNFMLKPSKQKVVELKYSVKFPKNRSLNIE